MASAGPTASPGWYPDPQIPGMMRYWDGATWTAQTAPAAPPPSSAPGRPSYAGGPPPYAPGGPPYASGPLPYAGMGPGQGARRGGFIGSLFPPRPGESEDDTLVRGFAGYERLSGWAWIVIGVIQVICLITIIAGAWNIYVGTTRLKMAQGIEARNPTVPAAFESLTGYVIIGILNLVLGGVLGLALLAVDLYVRDQVLKNRNLFTGPLPPGPPPPGVRWDTPDQQQPFRSFP